jgi:hypothetical protein
MKCQKCGFVSFDYLSQCKKCGTDLTAVREQLGFSALKSETPFLLGSLLKDGGRKDSAGGSTSEEARAPGHDFDFSTPRKPSELEPASESGAADSKRNAAAERVREDEIIELSEEDLADSKGD